MLRVLGRFADAQREGRGLTSTTLCKDEPFLTDDLLQRYFGDLNRVGVIQRNESGEWVVVRDFATTTLLEIYDEGGYRLPYDANGAPESSPPAVRLVAHLADDVRSGLDVPLSEIFPPKARSDVDAVPRRESLPMEQA